MHKVLYTATSDIHLRTFHIPYLQLLQRKNCAVDIAYEKRDSVKFLMARRQHLLPFKRNPLHPKNIIAFLMLKGIIKNNNYNVIHCHTPTVAALTRIAALFSRNNTTVIYTAHGYHFFKGAPLKMWILFYPIEYLISFITDVIVTINKEDYLLTKRKFKNKHTYYIKGVGVKIDKFKRALEFGKKTLREKYQYDNNDFILIYVAEFISRKNHRFLINSLPLLQKKAINLKLILAGTGHLFDEMQDLALRLEVENIIDFLGWRDDVEMLLALSDIGLSTSKQEGLGLGIAEAMHCGLPVIASSDRGHREMIQDGINGYMYDQGDTEQFTDYILKLYYDEDLRIKMGERSRELAKEFSLENSLKSMDKIYSKYL